MVLRGTGIRAADREAGRLEIEAMQIDASEARRFSRYGDDLTWILLIA